MGLVVVVLPPNGGLTDNPTAKACCIPKAHNSKKTEIVSKRYFIRFYYNVLL
jgi:hypothetical protein